MLHHLIDEVDEDASHVAVAEKANSRGTRKAAHEIGGDVSESRNDDGGARVDEYLKEM